MAISLSNNGKPSKWFSRFPRFSTKTRKSQNPSLSSNPSKTSPRTSSETEFQHVFRFFDSNSDGKISNKELSDYFVSIGESMSRDEAQRVINEFDMNGDGLLGFMEFVKLMERDRDDDIRRAFEMFEGDKGCGFISAKGLQRVFNRLGDEKSDEECEAMIAVFDLDGNGVLDFHEFHKMMA